MRTVQFSVRTRHPHSLETDLEKGLFPYLPLPSPPPPSKHESIEFSRRMKGSLFLSCGRKKEGGGTTHKKRGSEPRELCVSHILLLLFSLARSPLGAVQFFRLLGLSFPRSLFLSPGRKEATSFPSGEFFKGWRWWFQFASHSLKACDLFYLI